MYWHGIFPGVCCMCCVCYNGPWQSAMYNCWIRKSNYVEFEWFVAENRCWRRNSSAGLKRRKWTAKIRFVRKCAGLQGCWINKCRIREGRLYYWSSITDYSLPSVLCLSYTHSKLVQVFCCLGAGKARFLSILQSNINFWSVPEPIADWQNVASE